MNPRLHPSRLHPRSLGVNRGPRGGRGNFFQPDGKILKKREVEVRPSSTCRIYPLLFPPSSSPLSSFCFRLPGCALQPEVCRLLPSALRIFFFEFTLTKTLVFLRFSVWSFLALWTCPFVNFVSRFLFLLCFDLLNIRNRWIGEFVVEESFFLAVVFFPLINFEAEK